MKISEKETGKTPFPNIYIYKIAPPPHMKGEFSKYVYYYYTDMRAKCLQLYNFCTFCNHFTRIKVVKTLQLWALNKIILLILAMGLGGTKIK